MAQLPAADTLAVQNRIKRARGQLDGVLRMLEEGNECADVVTQLAAVSRALDKAGFALVAAGMKNCLQEEEGLTSEDLKRLEKVFLALA